LQSSRSWSVERCAYGQATIPGKSLRTLPATVEMFSRLRDQANTVIITVRNIDIACAPTLRGDASGAGVSRLVEATDIGVAAGVSIADCRVKKIGSLQKHRFYI
jgi:hypothetical protein